VARYKRWVDESAITLFRAPGLDALLNEALRRALPPVPPEGLRSIPRPAGLLLATHCAEWLDRTASDPGIVCLLLVEPGEAVADDPRIADVITATATPAELAMRVQRALNRKYAALPALPRADIDGVRWGDRFVPLSATEAQLAARLLAGRGTVLPESELAAAVFEDGRGTRRALHAHIYRLRLKLRPLATLEIQAVRQRGFRLVLKAAPPAGGS
jgi:Transcriptional regulatory protein, C terminal